MVTIFKELLENSLDANSNEISCFLKKFGLERIEFLDDGDGISKENLLLIGNWGASSKGLFSKDNSYGFWGESLFGLATLSKEMTIKSL